MEANTPLVSTKKDFADFFSKNGLRIGVHLIGVLPLFELAYRAWMRELSVNPIQYLEQFLGRASLNLLVVTLAVTPLITLTGWKAIHKHRRTLGLYTFFYFALHLLTFMILDYGFNLRLIYQYSIHKPFILIGLAAGLFLLSLAFTSYKYWMKFLGKKWSLLHKSVYLIGGLAVLHYALAVKGSLSTLSGNIVRPLVMAGLITLLLVLRIPPLKKWIIALRRKIIR